MRNLHRSCRSQCMRVFALLTIATIDFLICNADPPITALAFTKDQLQVISGSQRGLVVCNWPNLTQTRSFDCGLDNIHCIAPSLDRKELLVGGGRPGLSGVVQLRSWPELELKETWQDHRDVVYEVAWREDGSEWASVSWDGVCKVYAVNAKSAHSSKTNHSAPLFAATYLGGRTLATAGVDRTIVVSNTESGKVIRSLTQHTKTIHALASQPSRADVPQRLLASASEDRTVRFWQAEIGRMVRFLRFASIPRAIAWSPDGSRLVVGCDDGTVNEVDPDSLSVQIIAKKGIGVQNIIVDAGYKHIVATGGEELWSIQIPR